MSRGSAAALAVATWAGTLLAGPWWLAPLGPVLLLTAVRWRRRGTDAGPSPRDAGLLLAALVAAALTASGATGGRVAMRDAGVIHQLTSQGPLRIDAVVVTEPSDGLFDSWVVVRVVRVGDTRVRVRGLLRLGEPPSPGTAVRLTGRLRPLGDEGFDDHLRHLGAGVRVVPLSPPEVIGKPGWALRGTAAIRDRLHRSAVGALGPERASILTGLVTGDDRGRSRAVDDLLAEAGLSHLVVVSGRHTALFLGVVLSLARLARRGFRGSRVAALAALGWFVLLVRWQPSVLRAAAVATALLVADLTGRDRDAVHVLAMAVVVLLLADPLLGRRPGFVLSVSATAGVLLLAPAIAERISGPAWLRAALAVTLAAELAVAPVLLAGGRPVPVAGLVANLLAAPAAAVGQAVGGLAALLCLVSPVAGAAAARVGGWPVDAILWSARFAVRVVPGGLPSVGRLWLLAVLLLAAVLARVTGRRKLLRIAVVAVLVAAFVPVRPAGEVPALTVTALDVGQGDALLVSAPAPDGTHRMLVDAGADPTAAAMLLLRRGVRRLDAVVVTHPHDDHVGGVAEVLRRVQVGALLTGPTGRIDARVDPLPASARAAVAAARGAGVPVVELHAGRRLRLGEVAVRVLWPPPVTGGLTANDRSLVLRLDGAWGSALLTGDVEEAGQRSLLSDPRAVDVDLLKVPHHGGATNADGFLAATSPAVAVVSVGVGNDYGHPAPSTVQDLGGIPTLRTDLHGDVTVVLGPDRPQARVARSRPP